MDLLGYLRLLRRRWWIISLAVLISVGAAIGATQLQHKRYQTATRLLVSGSSSLSAVDEITRRQLAEQRAVLFSQIATTDPVVSAAEKAADDSGATPDVATANPAINATASGNDPFLTITVTADTPAAAQAIANVYAKILPTQLAKLDQLPSVVDTLLTVVNPAPLPTTPFSPKPLRNILIGLALGVVLGIAAALIRETLDTTLRDSDEIRRITRATILGIIPREFDDERLPAATRPHSRRSEAYRQVRTNLEFAAGDEPPRSFVITSAGQGEGKSTTVANLALLISRAGKRVAIVDADLRKPTLATFFNATNEYGLSDVLTGRAGLSEMLQTIAGEQITVLASGPNVPRPSELLSSPAMEHVLTTLHDEFDLVIVDSPPVLAVTDALLVGKHTDGMILISRMRRTTRSGLRRSMEAVERVHARLLGIIVNVAVESEDKRYGYTKGYSKGYLSGYLSEEHEPAAVEAHRVSISDDGPPTGETPAAMQPPPATPLQPVASTPLVPSPPPIVPAQLPVDTWNAGPDPVELPPPATTPPIVDETSEAHLIAAAPAEPEAVAEPEVIPEPETVPEADVVAEPSGLPATPWSQQPIPEWTGQPAYPTAPISPSVGQPQMPTPWIASSAPAPVPWQPEQLEQPAPTYAPNNRGAASSGAVRPDRESGIRSGGKRRRSRSGKGNAQDHER